MKNPRLHVPFIALPGEHIQLSDESRHYLLRVLRMSHGESVMLFDGKGGECRGEISIEHSGFRVLVCEPKRIVSSNFMDIRVGQGICNARRLEWAVEKLVELGVREITPIVGKNRHQWTHQAERYTKRFHKIAVSACQQSGRSLLPEINGLADVSSWLEHSVPPNQIALIPKAEMNLSEVCLDWRSPLFLLVGPDVGWSDREVEMIMDSGFTAVSLGHDHILRSETAGVATVSALNYAISTH